MDAPEHGGNAPCTHTLSQRSYPVAPLPLPHHTGQRRTSADNDLAAALAAGGVDGGGGSPAVPDSAGTDGAASGALERANFNLIPTREFGLQMLRMPGCVRAALAAAAAK